MSESPRERIKNPLVINLFGGPGVGKSTGAAYIFSMLKMQGINCELVTEFAKDKTWEHNTKALGDQTYVFGKQCYRINRCIDQVDVIVTDSPIVLSVIYNKNPKLGTSFNNMVFETFNSYNNWNYMLTRTKPYNPVGRNQTEAESDNIGTTIEKMLLDNNILYTRVAGDVNGYNKIIADILKAFKEN